MGSETENDGIKQFPTINFENSFSKVSKNPIFKSKKFIKEYFHRGGYHIKIFASNII